MRATPDNRHTLIGMRRECCGAYDRETCQGRCPGPEPVIPCASCVGGFIDGPTPDCTLPCEDCGVTGWRAP